jgi:hypothetical protein
MAPNRLSRKKLELFQTFRVGVLTPKARRPLQLGDARIKRAVLTMG